MKSKLLWLFSAMLLSACGTMKSFFAEDSPPIPPAELVDFAVEIEPQIIWSTSTGSGAQNAYADHSLWIHAGSVYAVDHKGVVVRHQADNGRRVWSKSLKLPMVAGVGGGEGLVVVGSQSGVVVALDAETGEERWRQTMTSEVLAAPTAGSGIVAVRTADGRVTGLSAADGSILWNHQRAVPLLSLRGASAPIIFEDKVIAGYDNGRLVAIAVRDGSVIWENALAVPRGRTELERLVDIDANPVIINRVVYAVSYRGNLAAISVDSGETFWTRELSSQIGLDVVHRQFVYVSDEKGHVWAIEDGSGDGYWRQNLLLRRQLSAPTVVGPYLVVGDFEGYLHWMSRDDGRFVGRQKLSKSAIRSQPQWINGVLYVNATDGTTAAIRADF